MLRQDCCVASLRRGGDPLPQDYGPHRRRTDTGTGAHRLLISQTVIFTDFMLQTVHITQNVHLVDRSRHGQLISRTVNFTGNSSFHRQVTSGLTDYSSFHKLFNSHSSFYIQIISEKLTSQIRRYRTLQSYIVQQVNGVGVDMTFPFTKVLSN